MPVRTPEDIKNEKVRLRRQILKERNAVSAGQREIWDRQILKRLIRYDQENPCCTYLCYVNDKSEVSTEEFICWCIKEGKTVFVPKVLIKEKPVAENRDGLFRKTEASSAERKTAEMEFYRITAWEDLKAGYQGIREPDALPENAFWDRIPKRDESKTDAPHFRMLLPGAAFDKKGSRIGYGGGFYDRWLAKWSNMSLDNAGKLEKIGLAYKMQVTDEIPVQPFDRKVDMVMTEETVFLTNIP